MNIFIFIAAEARFYKNVKNTSIILDLGLWLVTLIQPF